MLKYAVIAVSVLLAQGCAPQWMWMHPSHQDRAQFDQDMLQCDYEAQKATASYSSGPTRRTTSGAVAQGIGDGIELGTRLGNLIVLCMKTKGYYQKPVN